MNTEIIYDRDWTWIKGIGKDETEKHKIIKPLGFRFSFKRLAWYAPYIVPAESLTGILQDAPAAPALDVLVPDEIIPAPVTPKTRPSKPAPKSESDKAREWLASLDLANFPIDGDPIHAEFFKYDVAIYRGKFGIYLSTRSPQQKQYRHSLGTCWARSSDPDEVATGLERFIKDREKVQERHLARREAKRQARATFENPYKVGDFLYSSWGYDQTNREFYQILEVRPTALFVREVRQAVTERTGHDSWNCVPVPGDFRDRDKDHIGGQWLTIQVYPDGQHTIPSPIHGGLYKWDGRPLYASDGH